MKKKISVGYSTLSGRILAGYPEMDSKNNWSFIGEKYNVTHEVMIAVARKLLHDDEAVEWDLGDWGIIRLQVDLYQAEKPAHEKTGGGGMKYFSITYISQKTLHPEGYKTFTEFVAAETKHAAKLKALEILSEKDPDCCMMYKVPRLDEISEEAWCSGS